MKKILIVVLTLVSVKSFALQPKDPYAACNRITDGSVRTRCLTTIANRYVDPLAVAACDRISTGSATVDCLEAIVDRRYDPRAIEGCDSLATGVETTQCLYQVGVPVRGGGNYPAPAPDEFRRWAKEIARYALQQLDAGNYNEVRRVLNDLLRQ